MDEVQKKRHEIIDQAEVRGWVINPSKGMELYIESFFRLGHCPCDAKRPNCPCPESVEEVAKNGKCRCALFWASYKAFRKSLRPVKGGEDEGRIQEEIKHPHPGGTKKRSRRKTSK